MKAVIRIRMSHHDAHYGGNLVDGGRVLQLFGDVATELLIALDGDEGLFRAYDSIDFLHPVFSGDYLEVEGKITKIGDSSRRMEFEARKVIRQLTPTDAGYLAPSSAEVLSPPIVVVRATGTCITPKALQRTTKAKSNLSGA